MMMKEKEEEFRKLHPEDKFDKEETGCDTYEEWMNEEIEEIEEIGDQILADGEWIKNI